MSALEFRAWAEYYEAHPFDDLHRFHRPAALVASSFGGRKFDDALQFLAPELPALVEPSPGFAYSAADIATFKAFGRKPPVLKPRAPS
jgi:hypothetical protein